MFGKRTHGRQGRDAKVQRITKGPVTITRWWIVGIVVERREDERASQHNDDRQRESEYQSRA